MSSGGWGGQVDLSGTQVIKFTDSFLALKKEQTDCLNQIPELHIFNSRGITEMKGVGLWRVQGQTSCIHAAFVHNFLIEYKNR